MVADDYREVGAKILDPIAKNIPLGPMSISFLSLLTAIASGYSFYSVEYDLSNKEFLLLGSALVFLTAVLDALDGIVARKRGLSSKRGDLVDHTLDRVADILIIGGIALGPLVNTEVGFTAIIAVLMLSYMGTQAQAVGAGREYAGLLGRADRLIVLMLVPIVHFLNQEYNYMEIMCYAFAIICTLSAIYRFQRIWAELEE